MKERRETAEMVRISGGVGKCGPENFPHTRAPRHVEIFCTPKKELTMRRRTSNSRRKPLPRLPEAVLPEGQISPLQYMLAIINDPTASARRRDRMAVVAARYCHPRAGNLRKKDAEAEAAEK